MAVERAEYLKQAIAAATAAVGRAPGAPGPAIELAKLYMEAGRFAAVDPILSSILEADPTHGQALFLKARVHLVRGQLEAAGSTVHAALEADPENTSAYYLLALLEDRPLEGTQLENLEAVLEKGALAPGALADGGFALGHFLERRGEWPAAFAAYHKANAAQAAAQAAQGRVYSPEKMEARLQMFREFLGPEALSGIGQRGSDSERPMFVIGMPRSGTTLVERILAAHGKVLGCGERETLRDFVRRLAHHAEGRDFAAFLKVLETSLADWAAAYLDFDGRGASGTLRMVDKAPLNFEHLGLVELLFPAARVIVVRRDPRDVCVSIYRQKLRSSHLYATSLPNLGHFHRQFEAQMAFWRDNLNLAFYDLVYEDLVAEPEAEARRLIDFCGLEWEDGCLEFHKLGGEVASLSGAQVRRPISRKSIGFWRHYEAQLGPLLAALDQP